MHFLLKINTKHNKIYNLKFIEISDIITINKTFYSYQCEISRNQN